MAKKFLLFTTNFFYTIGLKLTSAVIGAAWQCTIPIFTSAYAILLGREKFTWMKAAGFMVASGGAAFILLFKPSSDSDSDSAAPTPSPGTTPQHADSFILGNLFFFFNTNALALYGIFTKPLMAVYTGASFTITSWTFLVTASKAVFLPRLLTARMSNLCI